MNSPSNFQKSDMKILIVEDEKLTADHMKRLVKEYDSDIQLFGPLDSIRKTIEWFKNPPEKIDLLFLDIMLADGTSFELFEKMTITTPVIFTTAYDEFALKAFKVNSVDYLLKPIDFLDLKEALDKFKKLKEIMGQSNHDWLKSLLQAPSKVWKKRFLIKKGDQIKYVLVNEIGHLEFDEGLVFAHLFNGDKEIIEQSLDELMEVLDPQDFFRINRKTIINISSIDKIHPYFNRRLSLYFKPGQKNAIVSRERVQEFKNWLDQ